MQLNSPIEGSSEIGIRNLLNCYVREIARPLNSLTVVQPSEVDNCSKEILKRLIESTGSVLRIKLPHTHCDVIAAVDPNPSLMGTYEYLGPSYFKTRDSTWFRLDALNFAELLNSELALSYQMPMEPDFMIQVVDSLRVQQFVLRRQEGVAAAPKSFLESEQSLQFGHPFHPSPKSRLDFSSAEVARYSPELKTGFRLHYFAVKREFLFQQFLGPLSCDEILFKQTQPKLPSKIALAEFGCIPTHPWQAKYLLQLPEIQVALRDGKILDLGEQGSVYFPTSSVRTVYSPGKPYFLKLSMNVRITNCIRKNTLHELKIAFEITRFIRTLQDSLQKTHPNFTLLEEPAFLTVDLKTGDTKADKTVIEGFGVILRETFETHLHTNSKPILAASLFGNQGMGRRWLNDLIPKQLNPNVWFDSYLDVLLTPLLDLFFKAGIMFEGHLQNVFIGLRDGRPNQVFVRDLENARMTPGSPAAIKMQEMNPDFHDGYLLSKTRAWNRFFYCLIVNHLGEAIYHLGYQNKKIERQLWDQLKSKLIAYTEANENLEIRTGIEKLISGKSLPGKSNMITRFQRCPDDKSSYVDLPNPFIL